MNKTLFKEMLYKSMKIDESARLKEYYTKIWPEPEYNLVIKTGLSDKSAIDVLNSVCGQLSDGIWENSPGMEKYWRYFTVDNGNILVDTQNWSSGFHNKSEEQIRKWLAGKVKQIVKTEMEDWGDVGAWDRGNDTHLRYMGYGNNAPTVKDAYRVYDKLMGRKDRIKEDVDTNLDEQRKIYKYLNDNKLYPYDVDVWDGEVRVYIDWGDWKHEHLRCKYLMSELGYQFVDEEVTEEDGSDTYSSIHTYVKSDLDESLLKEEAEEISWKEILDRILNAIGTCGFVLDNSVTPISKNLFRGRHLQIINPDLRISDLTDDEKVEKEFYEIITPLVNVLHDIDDTFEKEGLGYITFNIGINDDGVITAGMDFREAPNKVLSENCGFKKSDKKKLKEDLSYNLEHDVYSALSDIAWKYTTKGINVNQQEFHDAIDWFDSHFWDYDKEGDWEDEWPDE